MTRYLIRRLFWFIPTLWVIITLSFFLIRLAPGSPFANERAYDPVVLEALKEKYGLEQPLWKQYVAYLGRVCVGDFGPSYKVTGWNVSELLALQFPVSLQLGLFALTLAVLFGTLAGTVAAIRQNQWVDYTAMTLAMVGVSIPSFVSGPLLLLFFAVHLKWFQVAEWGSFRDLILPGAALGLRYTAVIARLTRAGMLEVIRQDHVRTARAKGVSGFWVVWRHCLRGALLPVVSYLGPATAGIVTGSLVIELIFGIPGVGRQFANAAFNRDHTMVMGIVITYSALLILMNLAVDLAYRALDPRMRLE